MKNKDSELKLYKEAYKLFVSKPYELVTVRDLEQAINMTRGAIFYYVKDKEQLFREVIERYYLKAQDIYNRVGEDILEKDITLLQFIDIVVAGLEKTVDKMYMDGGIIDKNNPDKRLASHLDRFYISLLLNAGFYLNDFVEKMNNLFSIEKNTWSFFIQKGIEKGEIKPNTDVKLFSELFMCIYLGKALKDSLKNGISTAELRDLFLGIYNKIKV
jgi:AcrR family transcriptional regulator